jgi:uncharacterized protein (DUF983 family)
VKVGRLKVIERGVACRCPNCGSRTLFQRGMLFKVNESCDGAFLGPFVMNYGVISFGVVIPVILLFVTGKLTAPATLVLCFAACLFLPFLLYRLAWGWWLMLYYFFLPDNLPANLEGRPEDDA